MLEQSKFLVSFDCQNEKFCEELITTYRTEKPNEKETQEPSIHTTPG